MCLVSYFSTYTAALYYNPSAQHYTPHDTAHWHYKWAEQNSARVQQRVTRGLDHIQISRATHSIVEARHPLAHRIVVYRFCHFWHNSYIIINPRVRVPPCSVSGFIARHLTKLDSLTYFSVLPMRILGCYLPLVCTIPPKDHLPRMQQWRGLSEVKKSQTKSREADGDTRPPYIPRDSNWTECFRTHSEEGI